MLRWRLLFWPSVERAAAEGLDSPQGARRSRPIERKASALASRSRTLTGALVRIHSDKMSE